MIELELTMNCSPTSRHTIAPVARFYRQPVLEPQLSSTTRDEMVARSTYPFQHNPGGSTLYLLHLMHVWFLYPALQIVDGQAVGLGQRGVRRADPDQRFLAFLSKKISGKGNMKKGSLCTRQSASCGRRERYCIGRRKTGPKIAKMSAVYRWRVLA